MSDMNDRSELHQIRAEIERIILLVRGDGLPSIPDDVPILDLGISSLALVEGMRRVYDRFGVLVSIRRVIEGQISIGALALYIQQELRSQGTSRKGQGSASVWKVDRQIPFAPSQQQVGFLSRYSSEAAAAFNEAVALRLTGPLHAPALHAAVEEAGNRYEALRTALDPELNALNVGVGESLELTVSSSSESELQARLAKIVAHPFEAGRRLFRADLLRLSEDDHVLVMVGHALVIDPRSMQLIMEEIADLYRAFSQDRAAAVETRGIQWTDYLALSQTRQAKEAQRRAEEYWKRTLAGGTPRLELPGDHPRPSIKRYAGQRAQITLDSPLLKRLRELAAAEDAPLGVVLVAALSAFICRAADMNEMVIGVESGDLYLEGGTPAIAPTRALLPLLTRYDAYLGFGEYLRRLAVQLAKANEYRHLSLYELIRSLGVTRDQSRSPLFTIVLRDIHYQTAPAFEELVCTLIPVPSTGARYDLELIPIATGKELSLVCDFSAEILEAETITRWLEGIKALLGAAAQDPGQPCGWLPLMTPEEKEKIISDWNRTDRSFAREQTVLDLIYSQARERPDATAVRFGDTAMTYAQLVGRVEGLASALLQRGMKHQDRVGILMRRSLDLIPSILAAARIGALHVPIDPGFPKKRIDYMLTDADVSVVLVDRELARVLHEEWARKAVVVDHIETGNSPALVGVPSARGSDSAHIIYTSGSTGVPKGVEILHSALLNCLLATREYLEFTSASSMLALTTISFDISANELLMPLICGGSVDLGEDDLVADGLRLRERIENRRPSHVQATPSTWKSVLAAGWQGDSEICLSAAGEALDPKLAEDLVLRSRALWNLYGPSETTVFSSAWKVSSVPGEPVRIGRPLPNTTIYVLDGHYQPVPIGAVGSLYIGGAGLAAGYWRKPELTDERFIGNPFAPGERMYWTGDLARYLPDGSLVCLGRIDDQLKIHGVRIEPGEVESALRAVESVRDAVVVPWRDSSGNTQLVAHVIPAHPGSFDASAVRSQLRERLPEVMIPPFILTTDHFPRTENGKVRRAALPPPERDEHVHSGGELEAPATPTEKRLATAWAGVLGIDSGLIGRDSDFLDLGGHSLLMTVLMSEIRKLFQVSFYLREFFAASTLRKLAALIDGRREQQPIAPKNLLRSASSRTPDWARQRMAFLHREAELPRYIAPARGLAHQSTGEIRNVLVTGATGFLGAYITAEILKSTDANVHCLVRPKRGQDSRERVERQLKRYHVWDTGGSDWQSAWHERLHVVDGEITLSRLGIPDPHYDRLARDVDIIFHSAAHVNFIYPYEALRATNVLGIHEIIQFAFHARIKPVHHLSTAAIWPMGAQYTYHERDSIDHEGPLNLGYDESKWVGEKCLLHAAERGLPVARYRPGEVGGDSVTGRCVTDHFLMACFKGFLQYGAFPALDIEVDVAPVDYVARAVVHMAFRRDVLGRAFHLTNPSRRRLKDGLAYLRGLGYRFEELPFVRLRDELLRSSGFAENALFAYQAALEEMDDVSMQLPTYDTSETQRELEGSGIACPPADEKLFGTYLHYLQDIGFVPPPVSVPAGMESAR